MKKIAIIGAGVFGFALAKIIGDKHSNKEIFIYDVKKEHVIHIIKTKQHPVWKSIAQLALHLKATYSLDEAVSGAELVILAVPSVYMRSALKDFKPHLKEGMVLLNVAKGLENKTNMVMSEVIKDELKDVKVQYHICSLSGGMIAKEVVLKNPLCAEVACADLEIARRVVKILENDHFRLEVSTDVLGIDLAGAFKNVVAIGAGLFDGLGYSASSKSAFVSYAAKQMSALAFALGAQKHTFDIGSQAWFGDLMTTCFGKSRNREFGELIGKTKEVKKSLKKLIAEGKTVEGYITAKVVYDLIVKHNIDAPLIKMVYSVLYKRMSPEKFIRNFIQGW